MVVLNSCCCCISLRTGTLILLWLSAIGGAISTLGYGLSLLEINTLFGGLELSIRICATFFLIAFFALSVASLATAIIGINGMRRNIPNSLLPYLYYMGSFIVCFIFFILVAILFPKLYPIFLTRSKDLPAVTTIGGIFTCLSTIAFQTYFLIVVESYRDAMVQQAARNSAITTA